ncbi:MAG: glycosyltransferase family 39 protein [Bryobacteraceae bacterium]|nr:glycosyltransferase family 39 protein [Bryobacteraceae bacterium]
MSKRDPRRAVRRASTGNVARKTSEKRDWLRLPNRIEEFAARRAVTIVFAIVLGLGLLYRYQAAAWPVFNGDEALHFLIGAAPSFREFYAKTLEQAHPPLYFFLLRLLIPFSASEVWLRMPSVIAGAGLIALVFVWIRSAFGPAAGIAAATAVAVNGFLIDLSAQVRGYALLHAAMAAAFLFQFRYLRSGSRRALCISVSAAAIAILIHYSALVGMAALGTAALVQSGVNRDLRRRIPPYAVAHLATLALLGFLYVTHIRSLRGSPMEAEAATSWLARSYFDPASERAKDFAVSRTWEIAVEHFSIDSQRTLFWTTPLAQKEARIWYVLGALLALGLLRRRRSPEYWALAAAFVAAYSVAMLLALNRLYPYGPTRHASILILFSIPLLAVAASDLLFGKSALVLAAIAFLYPQATNLSGFQKTQQEIRESSLSSARDGIALLRETIPRGDTIMASQHSMAVLVHRLYEPGKMNTDRQYDGLWFTGRYRIFWPHRLADGQRRGWFLWPNDTGAVDEAVRVYRERVPEARHVWAASSGEGTLPLPSGAGFQVSHQHTAGPVRFYRIGW